MSAAAQQRSAQSSPFAQVLASSRPLSWVNTAYPFAVAYLLAGGRVDLAWVVGTLWCLVPYNLLMYGVNDVFDYESDIRNPRKGGIEGVVLDRGLHRATLWSVVVSNLPFVVALVLLGDLRSTLVLAVSVFALVAYSAPGLRFKERPFLDSLTSSTHFVSPAVLGIALAGGTFDPVTLAALTGFFAWGSGRTPSARCRTSRPTGQAASLRSAPSWGRGARPASPCSPTSSAGCSCWPCPGQARSLRPSSCPTSPTSCRTYGSKRPSASARTQAGDASSGSTISPASCSFS